MNQFKKLFALLLALVMVLSLAACAPKDNAEDTKPADTKPADTKPTDTEPVDPHAEAVPVTWFLLESNGATATAEVEAEVIRYVKEKLNIDLTIEWFPQTDTEGLLKTALRAGDDWDLCCLDTSMYNELSSRGGLLDMTDYANEEYLPHAMIDNPEVYWEAIKQDGKIWGVPMSKDRAMQYNWVMNTTMLEDLGIEGPSDFLTEWDLVDWYTEVQQAHDAKYPDEEHPVVWDNYQLGAWYFYDTLVNGSTYLPLVCTNFAGLPGFESITDDTQAFCPLFTEDYTEWLKVRKERCEEGLVYGYPAAEGDPKWWPEGYYVNSANAGLISWDENSYEKFKSALYLPDVAFTYTNYIRNMIYSINADCEHPERVVELIDFMFEDMYLATILRFGIEGKDWADADGDNVVELLDRNSDPKNRSFYFWYGTNTPLLTSKSAPGNPNFAEAMREINLNAVASQNMGFIFDNTNVANEIGACTNVMKEYNARCKNPVLIEDVDAFVAEYQQKLKDNGIDKIIAEVQTQLDAWRAAK